MSILTLARAHGQGDERSFVLQRAQPAMTGLIDGSLSTLAPIFAVAFATHQPRYAFLAGLATAIGAGVSMAFPEGLSDTGDLTGRGSPYAASGTWACRRYAWTRLPARPTRGATSTGTSGPPPAGSVPAGSSWRWHSGAVRRSRRSRYTASATCTSSATATTGYQ
jgi:hypothetical protein